MLSWGRQNGHSASNITELVTRHNWQCACVIVDNTDTLHALQLQDWITHNDGLSTPIPVFHPTRYRRSPHMSTHDWMYKLACPCKTNGQQPQWNPHCFPWIWGLTVMWSLLCTLQYVGRVHIFFSFWATSPVQVSSNLSCDNQRVVGSLPWQALANLSVQLGAHIMTHSNIHVLNLRCSKYSSKGILYVAGTPPCPTIVPASSSPKMTFNLQWA